MTGPAPDVSVVMAVYNGERHLAEAIASILGQSFRALELVVVDDGSTDGSADIIKRFADADSRVVVVRQANAGLTKALIKAIGLARGCLIARQDADDISDAGRLEAQVAYLDRHPRCGLVGCAARVVGQGEAMKITHGPKTDLGIRWALRFGNVFVHGSVMFRRSVYDEVGGYDASFPVAQDFHLWVRMARVTKFAIIRKPLYTLHVHATSISNAKADLQVVHTARAIADAKATAQGAKVSQDAESLIYARLYLRRGKFDKARDYYGRVRSLESIVMRLLLKSDRTIVTCKKLYTGVRSLLPL